LSIVVTLLGVLLTKAAIPGNSRYAIPALYLAIIVALLILGFVHVNAHIAELRRLRREITGADTLDRLVPTYVRFKRREDLLVVEPNGNATLTWNFELVCDSHQHITELTFSIYAEVPAEKPPEPAIMVERIEVNGQARETVGVYQLVEKRKPMDRPPNEQKIIQFGLLRIPVDLERGHERCNVRVVTKHYCAYPRVFDVAPLFVDIPYLTEQLRVTVVAKGYAVRRPPGKSPPVEAMSSLMHTEDSEEANRQSMLCTQQGSQLVWSTDSPKLGYHYKVFFRLEQAGGA